MNTLLALFVASSVQYRLPKDLLYSLCRVESAHNISAIHEADGIGNSVGICQIKLKTAKMLGFKGSEKQLMNPNINIHYAAKYLAHQLKRYNGQVNKAVIAYNQGHAGNLTSTKYQRAVFNEWNR